MKNLKSNNKENNYSWRKTSEYPFYFVRKESEDNDYESISIYFAGDQFTSIVEKHSININDIPKKNLSLYKKEVSNPDEDFALSTCVERALLDGFGDVYFSKNFTISSIDELNEFLTENGIDYSIDEEDFSM